MTTETDNKQETDQSIAAKKPTINKRANRKTATNSTTAKKTVKKSPTARKKAGRKKTAQTKSDAASTKKSAVKAVRKTIRKKAPAGSTKAGAEKNEQEQDKKNVKTTEKTVPDKTLQNTDDALQAVDETSVAIDIAKDKSSDKNVEKSVDTDTTMNTAANATEALLQSLGKPISQRRSTHTNYSIQENDFSLIAGKEQSSAGNPWKSTQIVSLKEIDDKIMDSEETLDESDSMSQTTHTISKPSFNDKQLINQLAHIFSSDTKAVSAEINQFQNSTTSQGHRDFSLSNTRTNKGSAAQRGNFLNAIHEVFSHKQTPLLSEQTDASPLEQEDPAKAAGKNTSDNLLSDNTTHKPILVTTAKEDQTEPASDNPVLMAQIDFMHKQQRPANNSVTKTDSDNVEIQDKVDYDENIPQAADSEQALIESESAVQAVDDSEVDDSIDELNTTLDELEQEIYHAANISMTDEEAQEILDNEHYFEITEIHKIDEDDFMSANPDDFETNPEDQNILNEPDLQAVSETETNDNRLDEKNITEEQILIDKNELYQTVDELSSISDKLVTKQKEQAEMIIQYDTQENDIMTTDINSDEKTEEQLRFQAALDAVNKKKLSEPASRPKIDLDSIRSDLNKVQTAATTSRNDSGTVSDSPFVATSSTTAGNIQSGAVINTSNSAQENNKGDWIGMASAFVKDKSEQISEKITAVTQAKETKANASEDKEPEDKEPVSSKEPKLKEVEVEGLFTGVTHLIGDGVHGILSIGKYAKIGAVESVKDTKKVISGVFHKIKS